MDGTVVSAWRTQAIMEDQKQHTICSSRSRSARAADLTASVSISVGYWTNKMSIIDQIAQVKKRDLNGWMKRRGEMVQDGRKNRGKIASTA